MKNIFDLTGKVIIITGAAGYLGTEYAKALSKAGASLVLADINYKQCVLISSQISKDAIGIIEPIKLDLNKKSSIVNFSKIIKKKFTKIDVLINNAAYQGNSELRKISVEEFPLKIWENGISTNLTGIFLMCQEIGKIMVEQKFGNIINISSTYGIVGPDQRIYGDSGQNAAAFYSASKAGVIGLTKYLAAYWERKGIRVNSFSPGGVKRNQTKSFIKNYSDRTILGRMAEKEEYIGPIIFLASDASSYMTGSNLIVDGGWTAW